jgi:opacity protein-like surface antigen
MSVVATGPVWASDWNVLDFYAGAGIGESTVRSDYGFDPSYPTDSHPHHTAYKVLAGIRPLPFVGAEAEYIDFGHPSSSDGYFNNLNSQDYNADSHPKAGVLSAVGYLPLPYMDVFARAGVARLETNLNTYTEVACSGTDTASSNWRRASAFSRTRGACRIRADQVGVRRSRRVHAQCDLDVLIVKPVSSARVENQR